MSKAQNRLKVRLAETAEDLRAAQRLRYQVFVQELGGDGEMVDHGAGIERDAFDAHSAHLLLLDQHLDPADNPVVGTYRMMTDQHAREMGRFYSASEFDLAPLLATGRPLLELGRSCVHKDYRGGSSMVLLWNALARYVLENDIEILFGVASFHGVDIAGLTEPLSYLHAHHLAPTELRVSAIGADAQAMDLLPADQIDRVSAMRQIPPLIKAYLRLGGFVGEGAYIDHAFNTTDVCLLMDTANMNARSKDLYVRKAGK